MTEAVKYNVLPLNDRVLSTSTRLLQDAPISWARERH